MLFQLKKPGGWLKEKLEGMEPIAEAEEEGDLEQGD